MQGNKNSLCEENRKPSLCVFEFVYFARPDTVIGSLTVEHVRQNFGKALAKRDTTEADIVIGVPIQVYHRPRLF